MISQRSLTTYISKDGGRLHFRLTHKPSGMDAHAVGDDYSECKERCLASLEERLGDTIERGGDA